MYTHMREEKGERTESPPSLYLSLSLSPFLSPISPLTGSLREQNVDVLAAANVCNLSLPLLYHQTENVAWQLRHVQQEQHYAMEYFQNLDDDKMRPVAKNSETLMLSIGSA